jgi:hypothetical protein
MVANFSLDKRGLFRQNRFCKKGGEKPGISLVPGFLSRQGGIFSFSHMDAQRVGFLLDRCVLQVSCVIAGEWETWEMLFGGSACERIDSAPLCYMKELPEIGR